MSGTLGNSCLSLLAPLGPTWKPWATPQEVHEARAGNSHELISLEIPGSLAGKLRKVARGGGKGDGMRYSRKATH
jgi:hypothetical protein